MHDIGYFYSKSHYLDRGEVTLSIRDINQRDSWKWYENESNEKLKYFKVSQQLLISQGNSPGQGRET